MAHFTNNLKYSRGFNLFQDKLNQRQPREDIVLETSDPKKLQAVNSSELKTAEINLNKKPFVEPEISAPVNVLEATTFLQTTESGTTN
jgi:hypothetical protein